MRKVGDFLAETPLFEMQEGERGGEVVYRVIENFTGNHKVGKREGEVVNKLIEICSESQMGERRWEVINIPVEFCTKREMGEMGGKLVVYFLVEKIAKNKMDKRRGKVWDRLVKLISQG